MPSERLTADLAATPSVERRTVVIVPCGRAKIWDRTPDAGPTEAKDAYTGSPFVVNRRYAEAFGTEWRVLSAKYGFLQPTDIVHGPYDTTFKRKSSDPISNKELREQVAAQGLDEFDSIVGLGGVEYRRAIEAAFTDRDRLVFPFAGLPIGKMMRATKAAIGSGNPVVDEGVVTVPERPEPTAGRSTMKISREAVLKAIALFDDLGRDAFLRKFGFGKARSYQLLHDGREYDSKAIIGVAYGFDHPDAGPLRSGDFVGGAATVGRWLNDVGFDVRGMERPTRTETAVRTAAPTSAQPLESGQPLAADAVCGQVHSLIRDLPVFTYPFDFDALPTDGIYILFEDGEAGHGGDRIVRIGTHTGDGQLRSRLSQHLMSENKDRSIFRKNIGRCLLNRDGDPFLDDWNLDLTTQAARDKHADRIDAARLQEVERRVSEYMRRSFRFAVIPVPTKSDRLRLESRLIATVSNCASCGPSTDWLGRHSPSEKICRSGLWQVNELWKTGARRMEIEEIRRVTCNAMSS